MKKIAVIFPGIGYHTDKPLLYYSTKIAMANGYDVRKINYPEYKVNLKGASEKELLYFVNLALETTKDALKEADFSIQSDILFISKSIGTVIASAYARSVTGSVRHILYTPLEQTFEYADKGSGIAFNGTKDNWADCVSVRELSLAADIPITTIENANHSLETGDVMLDLNNLCNIMKRSEAYIRESEE